MNYVEYGVNNSKVIMLLHGGGLSWWNYKEAAELLQEEYRVVLPILDGHAGSDRDFVSIEENAAELIRFVDSNYNGQILMLAGLSLGAQIAVEILCQRPDFCRCALIESAAVIPMQLMGRLIPPAINWSYGLIEKEWFSKLQFDALKMKKTLYEDYYRDSCLISKKNMIAFLQANVSYSLKEALKDCKSKVLITCGEKEQKRIIDSAYRISQMIEGSTLEVLKGLDHGEFSINTPEEYVKRILKQIEEK